MTDLVTLAQVKTWAGITGASDDAVLGQLITSYSAWVRSYTGRDFTIQSYARSFSGRDHAALMLPQWPIVSVDALSIGNVAMRAQSLYGGYGFRFAGRSIILDGALFPRGRSNIRVAWTAGYDAVPDDVAQATAELVALRYAERGRIGYVSKSLAGETVTFMVKDMPASVATALAQWVNVI